MGERGMLWIIPDEGQIIQPLFERKVDSGVSHTDEINEFIKKYDIDLNFKQWDYHAAPCMVAQLGHLVIKSDDDVSQLIFYIPELVTDRQLQFIYNNHSKFSKYQVIGGYSLIYLDDGRVAWTMLHGISQVLLEINKRNNIKGKNKGGKKYVR